MKQKELEKYWHTSSHILAHAVKRIFPEVKLGTGPAIEKGFYYDFYREKPFTPEDLDLISAEMSKIIKEDLPVEKITMSRQEASGKLCEEPFKQEILSAIKDDADGITFYRQGDFYDLCSGPHLSSTGAVRHYKLLSVAASCWQGDENRESMQRIYGISFPDKAHLKEHMDFLREARERDHRTIGPQLDLFSIHPDFGSGLIYWHPRGAAIKNIIEGFWKRIHLANGYELVSTPHIADISLWEKSGHLDFYREYMFPAMETEKEIKRYQVKPMNCPFHMLIYNSCIRSYRELPIRWAELGTVYRYEKQGVLHGLLRARGFTQDDAHIFCAPEQMEEEILKVLKLVAFFFKSFGFDTYSVFLSTKPERSVGGEDNWEAATGALKGALEKARIDYEIDPGEGVFYGPKIDIKIKDCLGREWQCSTIQVDCNILERFCLEYVNEAGDVRRPIMIHRAILGSVERFFGILVEHFKGSFPFWLAPEQVRILPISDRHTSYASEAYEIFREDFRVGLDARNEKINRKIRDAEKEKVPFMLVIGDKEVESGTLSLREHRVGMKGAFTQAELKEMFNGLSKMDKRVFLE